MAPWLAHALWLAAAAAVLAVAVWHDARSMRIPNGAVLAALAAGLVLALLPHGLGWASAVLGVTVALGGLLPLYALRVMGAGDVKLLAALGAFTGFPGILHLALYTMLAGGLLAIFWSLFLRRGAAGRPSPAGVGCAAQPRIASQRMPYAIAIAIGMAAFAFQALRPA